MTAFRKMYVQFEAGTERLLIQFPGFPVCIDFNPSLVEIEGWLCHESVPDPRLQLMSPLSVFKVE